jgi:hypothetical protein
MLHQLRCPPRRVAGQNPLLNCLRELTFILFRDVCKGLSVRRGGLAPLNLSFVHRPSSIVHRQSFSQLF